jgi:hypothetical protein
MTWWHGTFSWWTWKRDMLENSKEKK